MNSTRTSNGHTLTGLVSGIIGDVQTLIRQEFQLARVEVKQELTKTRNAAITFGAGTGMIAWSGLLLTLALIFFLNWITGDRLPLWACFAIIGGLILIGGVILLYIGKNRVEDIHLVPRQTAETMRENVQWIRNRT